MLKLTGLHVRRSPWDKDQIPYSRWPLHTRAIHLSRKVGRAYIGPFPCRDRRIRIVIRLEVSRMRAIHSAILRAVLLSGISSPQSVDADEDSSRHPGWLLGD